MVAHEHALEERRARLAAARLYLICDARAGGPHVTDPGVLLRAALEGGVDIVQLRAKHADDSAILAAGEIFRRICDEHGALFVVNDRPHLARACRADGVHVGQDDAPVAKARMIAGAELLVGLSTHTTAQLDAAGDADYIGVGPVYATPTKPGRPAVGLELVRYAATRAASPFFAIGGIEPANVTDVVAAGAPRIAVMRAICEASDPRAAAAGLRVALERGAPVGAA